MTQVGPMNIAIKSSERCLQHLHIIKDITKLPGGGDKLPELAVSVRDRVLWTSNAFYDASIRLEELLSDGDQWPNLVKLLPRLQALASRTGQSETEEDGPTKSRSNRQTKVGRGAEGSEGHGGGGVWHKTRHCQLHTTRGQPRTAVPLCESNSE